MRPFLICPQFWISFFICFCRANYVQFWDSILIKLIIIALFVFIFSHKNIWNIFSVSSSNQTVFNHAKCNRHNYHYYRYNKINKWIIRWNFSFQEYKNKQNGQIRVDWQTGWATFLRRRCIEYANKNNNRRREKWHILWA